MDVDQLMDDYRRVCASHSGLVSDLECQIEAIVATNGAIENKSGYKAIMAKWNRAAEWPRVCGEHAKNVFGVVLRKLAERKGWEKAEGAHYLKIYRSRGKKV